MADAVTASVQFIFQPRETLDADDAPLAGSRTVFHTLFDKRISYTGTAPFATSAVIAEELALSGGALTLDLTAAPKTGGGTQDLTGVKPRALMIYNPVGNGALTLAPGASNGYELLGSGNEVVLPAGVPLMVDFGDALIDVDGTHKTLDFSGTGAESFIFGLLLG